MADTRTKALDDMMVTPGPGFPGGPFPPMHRVPIFSTMGRGPRGEKGDVGFIEFADPIEHDKNRSYGSGVIVLGSDNVSYLSKQDVPVGIELSDTRYWGVTATPSAQVEEYRQEALDYRDEALGYALAANNPIYYGADPTGVNDSSVAINACFDANINGHVQFTPGTYLINSPIEIDYSWVTGEIDFNGATINDVSNSEYGFGIGTKNVLMDSSIHNENVVSIHNFKIVSNSVHAILIERAFGNCHLEAFNIVCSKNGLKLGKEYEGYAVRSLDAYIDDFLIKCTSHIEDGYNGIEVIANDSRFANGRIYGFKHGVHGNGNLTIVDNCHFLILNENVLDWSDIDTTYCAIYNPGILQAANCYCDTYPCFAKTAQNSMQLAISNLFIYSYHADLPGAILDFSDMPINQGFIYGMSSITGVQWNNANYAADAKLLNLPINQVEGDVGQYLKELFNNIQIEYSARGMVNRYDFAKKRKQYTTRYWPSNVPANTWFLIGIAYLATYENSTIVIDSNFDHLVFNVQFAANTRIGNISLNTSLSTIASGSQPKIGFKHIEGNVYEVYLMNEGTTTPTNLNVFSKSWINQIFEPVDRLAQYSGYTTTDEMDATS